jgi:D-3-phosphoglycerate dehydrogenase / 2-oxoglutarate reductase
MNTVRLVSTGPVPPLVREILKPFGPVEIATSTDEDSLIQWMTGTIGLIVRGVTKVSARVIEAGTQLRVIGRSGIGCDNVDVGAATARGIPVVYTPGAGSRAVAEGAMALLLALAKSLPQLDASTKHGEWQTNLPARIDDLAGSTIGIVGLGRIGKELAKIAHAFEMRVIAYDPYIPKNDAVLAGAGLVELDSLFTQSDFICLHASLTDATRGMVSRRRLSLVKPTAVIVNLARGSLFESLDIVHEALQANRLSGVGMDTFPSEPPDTSHPIFSHPRVLCTPHVLGLSVGATTKIFTMMSEGMAMVLKGLTPDNVINPEAFQSQPQGAKQ